MEIPEDRLLPQFAQLVVDYALVLDDIPQGQASKIMVGAAFRVYLISMRLSLPSSMKSVLYACLRQVSPELLLPTVSGILMYAPLPPATREKLQGKTYTQIISDFLQAVQN